MAWKRLISVRNETKNFFSRQRPVQVRLRGVPVTADWAPAPWLRDHSESHFFGDTLYLARGSCLNRPERERPDVAVDRAVRGGVGARGRGGHRAEHLATQPVNTGAWPVGKVSRCQDKLWQDLASSRPPALSCPRCLWWRTGLPPSPLCKRLPPWERACTRERQMWSQSVLSLTLTTGSPPPAKPASLTVKLSDWLCTCIFWFSTENF